LRVVWTFICIKSTRSLVSSNLYYIVLKSYIRRHNNISQYWSLTFNLCYVYRDLACSTANIIILDINNSDISYFYNTLTLYETSLCFPFHRINFFTLHKKDCALSNIFMHYFISSHFLRSLLSWPKHILQSYLNTNMIKPRTRPYIKCPPRLESAGIWPKGWLNGENPVIGLCIGTKVMIQSTKPYSVPNKRNEAPLSIKPVKNKGTINGKAIPASIPFMKWKKKIPLKWIFVLDSLNNRSVITWFSCHSNTPCKPQRFHDGTSVRVIKAVDTKPLKRPLRKYDNTLEAI